MTYNVELMTIMAPHALRADSREELVRALRDESSEELLDYLMWHNHPARLMGAIATLPAMGDLNA